MIIDLLHNKIVKDTATEAFLASVNDVLVPQLVEKYGDAIEAITMYEDYLADELLFEGSWYYPLSVKLQGEDAIISWIKWPVNKKNFRNNIPYAYVGDGSVDFSFAGFVPTGFADKLQGRAIDYDRDAIKLSVEAVTDDPLLLVGKYSQTFIDGLAHQITRDICRKLGVEGIENTTMELELVFAPGTYLEHTSENVTYRRLLLVDKGCQARDFWVKWTRLDGVIGYKISDHVGESAVKFELGEDVSQKIREKEYRFLAGANPSKYQAAMGKKTVTEWRDITKRALKRGELTKVVTEAELADHAADVSDKLRELLGSFGVATTAPASEPVPVDNSYDVVTELAKSVLANEAEDEATVEVEAEIEIEIEAEPMPEPEVRTEIEEMPEQIVDVFSAAEPEGESLDVPEIESAPVEDSEAELELELEVELELGEDEVEDEPVLEPVFEPIAPVAESEPAPAPEAKSIFDFADLGEEVAEEETFVMGEVTLEEYERATEENKDNAPVSEPVDEEAIRKEIEARIRLEYETEARQKAEREAEKLRQEHERLREENERLARLAKEAEARRIEEEAARRREEEARRLAEEAKERELEAKRAEEERIRAELEARMRLEAQERERIAEAARMAVEEQKRLEAERLAKAEREKQEALAREAERLRREEEARRQDEERRREEQRRREEEEKRRKEEAAARARVELVSKTAKLMFRYAVDINVMKRIQEVMENTLVENGKEDLNIRIKAYPQDTNSIALEIKLPGNEMELLVSMMKALGGASLGITKIVLE